jgi:hypothetical protein
LSFLVEEVVLLLLLVFLGGAFVDCLGFAVVNWVLLFLNGSWKGKKKVLFSRVERSLEFLTQVVCRCAGIAWREFGWGALASGFGETLLHPVDTLKTRIQSGQTGLSLQVELNFHFLGGSLTMLLL